jgi:hypothetical protein
MLRKHRSQYARYDGSHDPEVLRATYLHEAVPFIQELTGAARVIPREQSLRVRSARLQGLQKDEKGVEPASAKVHRDYTVASAGKLFEDEILRGGIERGKYSRFAIVQTWRVLSPPPQDRPLAVLDSSSVVPSEVVEAESVYGPRNEPGNVFTSSFGTYNPQHRWFWFPDMTDEEVIVFKGHDTLYPASMYTLHTSFDAQLPNAIPRDSVECRYFVFFD